MKATTDAPAPKTRKVEVDTSSFDEAAALAEKALAKCQTKQDVCNWAATWYQTAGHKRLSKILVQHANGKYGK